MPKAPGSVLRAVLFTDVVGSSELARELGDQRWARLLAAERRVIREQLRTHRGHEIDTAGDGLFAVFEGPADAVRCAFAATRDVQDLGLDIRAGVHFGEIDMSDDLVHGIVVHTGARVMSRAGPAEVLITQTVRDLVAGARFGLGERGTVELKGVPGTWTLYDVLEVDDQLRPGPIEEATVASERRERATASPETRRRRPAVLAIGALAIAALGAGLFALLRPSPTYVPGPGTVAEITGDRFDRPIAVGAFPLALTEGHGRIWVLDRQSQVYWVQESDGSTGSRGTDGVPTGAAEGDGALWITAAFGGGGGPQATVSRFDPASGQLSAAFQTPIGSQAIAFGAGAVWVADPNTGALTRYDPVARTTGTIPLPPHHGSPRPDAVAYSDLGGGALWVGDQVSTSVYRVDATGSNPVRVYTVGGAPTAIASGRGAIWVVSEHADAVYELDPTSGAIRNTFPLSTEGCSAPTSVAATADGVWVSCSLSHDVLRIEPTSGHPLALPVNGVPAALTSAPDGSVWVAVQPR